MAGVVVWAFSNDRKLWSPYDPKVSQEIENAYIKGNQKLNLGTISQALARYEIDFVAFTQTQLKSGKCRKIVRRIHPLGSALYQGVVWEFEGDNPSQWLTYDLDTIECIEDHLIKNLLVLDLSRTQALPYIIDLKQMNQTRKDTGNIRKIRRRIINQAYPLDTLNLSVNTQQTGLSASYNQTPLVTHAQAHTLSQPQQAAAHHQTATSYLHTPMTVTVNGGLPHSAMHCSVNPLQGFTQVSAAQVHHFTTNLSNLSALNGYSQLQPSASYTPPTESLPRSHKIQIDSSLRSKAKSGLEVLGKYMLKVDRDLDKHDCSICCDQLSQPSSYGDGHPDAGAAVKLTKCGHQFHKLCLLEMYNSTHKDDSLQCPSCKTIYGEKTGICPPGYMQWNILQGLPLAGYEDYDTICVSYHISAGKQGPEHPNPGQPYSVRGFPRQGFLPDNDKGRKVLKLLIEAFRRRLMFTIGTSHTTGEANTVTWNEIHHKTEPHGNQLGHGYPDPKYLDNVLLELAAHGVTEETSTS
ncbi:probable E3 ubiquitin-protein ligase DTX2 isoform X2 [Physella acuta]|uniref:probable E3 ubiquitin-protein ligase DTX2 isoform X2 n=1 Tax=Physella acuta TaxID=109671 RepID=UPI0027DB1F43|nr:probable E3 ubiquitin-protein ligase DTX2 isoform X2 [Physella acuta]